MFALPNHIAQRAFCRARRALLARRKVLVGVLLLFPKAAAFIVLLLLRSHTDRKLTQRSLGGMAGEERGDVFPVESAVFRGERKRAFRPALVHD